MSGVPNPKVSTGLGVLYQPCRTNPWMLSLLILPSISKKAMEGTCRMTGATIGTGVRCG